MVESGNVRPGGVAAAGKPSGGGSRNAEAAYGFIKRLGGNAQVFVQRPGADTDKHTGLLIGNLKNDWLLIGIYDGAEYAVGDKLQLRTAVGSHLVGFDTEVLQKFEDPALYRLAFPKTVNAVNLRKAERIQAFFPADVQVTTPGADTYLLKTRVLDISAGGCSFRSKTKLPDTSALKISFALPGDRQVQSVKSSVIESLPMGLVYHTRVRFMQEPTSVPILQEVAKWVAEGLTFTVS